MDKSKEIKIRKAVSLVSDVCQQQLIGQQRVQTLISELVMILNECFGEEHTNEILHALTDSGDGYFQPRELVFTLKFSLITKKAMTKKVKFAFNMIKCIFKELKRESSANQIKAPRNVIRSAFNSPDFIANESRVDDSKSIDISLKKDNETDTIVRYTDYNKKRTKEIAEALKSKNEKLVKEKTFIYWRNNLMINQYKALASLNNCIKIFKKCLGKHFGKILAGGKACARSKSFLSRLIKKSEIKNCKSPFKTWKKEKTHKRNMSASSNLQHTSSEKWSLYNARKILAGLEQTLFYFLLEKPFKMIVSKNDNEIIEINGKNPASCNKKPPIHKKVRSTNLEKEINVGENIGVITPSFKTSQFQTTQNTQVSDFGVSSQESSINKLSSTQLTDISIFGLDKSDEELNKTILCFNQENEPSRGLCDESGFNVFGENSANEVEDLLNLSTQKLKENELVGDSPNKEFVFWTDYVRVLSPIKNKARLRRQAQAESSEKDSLYLKIDKAGKSSLEAQNEENIELDIPKKTGSFSERNKEKRKLRSQVKEKEKFESIDESPIKPTIFNEAKNASPGIEDSMLCEFLMDLPVQNAIIKPNKKLCREKNKDSEDSKLEALPLAFRDKPLNNIVLENPKIKIDAVSKIDIPASSNESFVILNNKIPNLKISNPMNCFEIHSNNSKENAKPNEKGCSDFKSLKSKSFTPVKELHPKDSIESFKTDVSSSIINYHIDDDSDSYSNYNSFSLQHMNSIEIQTKIASKLNGITNLIESILSCHRNHAQRWTLNKLKDYADKKKSHAKYLTKCLLEALILKVLKTHKIKNQKVPYAYKSLSVLSLDSDEPMSEKDFVTAILLKDDPYYDENQLFKKRSANVLALAIHKAIKRTKIQNAFENIILYYLKKKKCSQKLAIMSKIIQEKVSYNYAQIFRVLLDLRNEFFSINGSYKISSFKNSTRGNGIRRYNAIDSKCVFTFTNKVETMLELALFKQKYMSFKCIQEESFMSTRHNKQKHKYGAKACLIILIDLLQPKFKKILNYSFESIKNIKFSIKHKHNSRPKVNVKAAIALYAKLLKISQCHSLNNKKKSFAKIYSYSKTLEKVFKLFKFTDLLASVIEKSNNKFIYSGFNKMHDKSERERIYKYVKVDYLFKKAFIRRLANAFVGWISNLERLKELDSTALLQRKSESKSDNTWRSFYSSYSTNPITISARKSDLFYKNRGIVLPVPKTIHDYIDDFNEVVQKKVDASYFSSPVPNADRLQF